MSVRDKIDSNFLYFFDQGKVTNAYEVFGAHLVKDEEGNNIACEFTLYAPNAKEVNIIGEWNDFDPKKTKMFCIDSKGIWYAKLEGNYEWSRYKYQIITKQNNVNYKSDPFAFYSALRPLQDSKVYNINDYKWNDDMWMYTHPKTYDKPVCIYEMHLGSWMRKGEGENDFYCYTEIAERLIPYLKEYGFTHVEFLPVYEHPLDASWGYQGVSYYSVSARYGDPKGLMYLIDQLHQIGVGVILDWVPGHICKDSHGLYMFDGTALYDYSDENIRENKSWGTANLDLGKGTTRSFLYSNAMFYLKYFHVDGFRVDAVSNLIYHLGNKENGVNIGACEFLRELSAHLFKYDDRLILSAEDSSDYWGVTKPASIGGLGFNYKWDMGWMNDTLKYFKLDPIYRRYDHHKLTFSMVYNYNEQFILPLSHDEVVHMKGSLLNKMPGDYWQMFANFKILIGYQMTHPGKKLLFMGSELAPFSEWGFARELDWNLMEYESHKTANQFVKDITNIYKNEKALYELELEPKGFTYIDADNVNQSLYFYARFAKDFNEHIIVVMNNTPNTYFNYRIGVMGDRNYYELINSDDVKYGGSGKINNSELKIENYAFNNQKQSILATIPPLGIVLFKMVKEKPIKKKNKV